MKDFVLVVGVALLLAVLGWQAATLANDNAASPQNVQGAQEVKRIDIPRTNVTVHKIKDGPYTCFVARTGDGISISCTD